MFIQVLCVKWLVYVNIPFLILDKTTENIKFIKIVCETCFHGSRELYFNSISVVGSLSNEIKVRKPTSPRHVSFMLEMEANDSHAGLSTRAVLVGDWEPVPSSVSGVHTLSFSATVCLSPLLPPPTPLITPGLAWANHLTKMYSAIIFVPDTDLVSGKKAIKVPFPACKGLTG